MGLSRKIARNRLRQGYGILSRRWREKRRSQAILTDIGVNQTDIVGTRPPISVFSRVCTSSQHDPVQLAKETSLSELMYYAAAPSAHGGLELTWDGWQPPAMSIMMADPHDSDQEGERGVMEIPMLGEEIPTGDDQV